MEQHEQGGVDLLFGLDQATMINEKLSSCGFLKNSESNFIFVWHTLIASNNMWLIFF